MWWSELLYGQQQQQSQQSQQQNQQAQPQHAGLYRILKKPHFHSNNDVTLCVR
jgi:hypothetical protein